MHSNYQTYPIPKENYSLKEGCDKKNIISEEKITQQQSNPLIEIDTNRHQTRQHQKYIWRTNGRQLESFDNVWHHRFLYLGIEQELESQRLHHK